MNMEQPVWNLLPPQRVPSEEYFVWHTGLSSSERLVTIGLVVEAPLSGPAAGENLGEKVPLGPSVWIFTSEGEHVVSLSTGGEGGDRNGLVIRRLARWDPNPGRYELKIVSESLGLDYSATFSLEGR